MDKGLLLSVLKYFTVLSATYLAKSEQLRWPKVYITKSAFVTTETNGFRNKEQDVRVT